MPHRKHPFDRVRACGQSIGSEIERIFPQCQHYLTLRTRGSR